MKIVLINTVCGTGSHGKIVKDLYNAYKDSGNEVKIIYGRGISNGVLEEDAYTFNSKFDFYYHALMSRLFDSQGLHSNRATKKMIAFLKEFNPDVVHLHNIHGYYLNYKLFFEYLANTNIKVVWTLHDCMMFTGHCSHFDYIGCDKWKTGCNHCPNKKEYPTSWFIDNSKRNYELKKQLFTNIKDMTIVCPSKWLAGKVEESFLNKYDIKVINNGIDLTNFTFTDNHTFDSIIDRNKKIVLAVANVWDNMKGYKDIINLSTMLDDNYQIVMVGVNNKQINELRSTKIAGITRTKNQKELAELYSVATIFINTTYQDNFPTVNIEALACGCPIITYDTGGSVEVINNDTGIIVEQGNIETLKDAIYSLGNYCREKMSKEAKSKYNEKLMCEKYLELVINEQHKN